MAALTYDPDQEYEVRVYDVEYRRAGGESWLARIYQPQGPGPFPALLDVHGGAWGRGTRTSDEPINKALAASGLVIVGIDLRLAPQHPYPAQVADVNYGTRWLKAHAQDFNAHPSVIGGLGQSSGGHTVMLSAMRPRDPRYATLLLDDAEDADAGLSYILVLWPVLDPYARYLYARESGLGPLVSATEDYFLTEDAMREGNPQLVLERGETVELPPTLIVQGTADANIPMAIPERFVTTYRAAGGAIELERFPDMPHGLGRFVGWSEEEKARALTRMKDFVASQLAAHPLGV